MATSTAPAPAATTSGSPLPLLALPQDELLTVNQADIPQIENVIGPGIHAVTLRLDLEHGELVGILRLEPGATGADAQALGRLAHLDAGRQTLAEFAAEWWELYAIPNLETATLRCYASVFNSYVHAHVIAELEDAPRIGADEQSTESVADPLLGRGTFASRLLVPFGNVGERSPLAGGSRNLGQQAMTLSQPPQLGGARRRFGQRLIEPRRPPLVKLLDLSAGSSIAH